MGELELGDDAYGDATTIGYEAAGALSAGDVVAINGGQGTTADDTTDTNPIGVVSSSVEGTLEAGDDVQVHVNGSGVVANVAASITAGTELAVSATEGQLAAGSGGFEALSGEGAASGLNIGASLPANGAVTKLP
jgi:hypothetical protein